MLIRIFSPIECGLIRNADLKKCGLNRMTTVCDPVSFFFQFSHVAPKVARRGFNQIWLTREIENLAILLHIGEP